MITLRIPALALLAAVVVLAGCAATQTFTTAARAGDTVALAVGWQKALSRNNIRVSITPQSGSAVIYQPNDPAVRGIINLYPDPLSKVVIGTNLNNDLGVDATSIGSAINQNMTGSDREWWQTTLFLDLPGTLAVGTAKIEISDATTNAVIQSSTIEILPNTGSPNMFNIYMPSQGTTVGSSSSNLTGSSGYYPNALLSLERTQHVILTFAKPRLAPMPQAIQVQLSHDASTGQSWVVNPRSDIKNVSWRDDGATITLLITAASGSLITSMKDLKVYLAGPVTGIAVLTGSLKAYDSNGAVISGVTSTTALVQ